MVPIAFLVHQATLSVKEGLDRETALRAITINPATGDGGRRPGSALLAAPRHADAALWSEAYLLDVMQRALRVFISGRQVYHDDQDRRVGSSPLSIAVNG